MSATTTASHAEPNYTAIFWYLLVLTIAEVGVTYMPLGKVVIGSVLVAMALGKAALVALFFMHLKFEKTTLGVIAVTPLLICVWLLFMLLPDTSPNLHRPERAASSAAAEPIAH